jgi:DNA-directed RNA polymerase specialized sigma24 family protein
MGQPAGEHEPELRVALWREIEALPLPLQAPVKLKLAGYSITEIAELAGIPRTTVGGRYNSACEQLRQRLDPHLDECSRSEEGS